MTPLSFSTMLILSCCSYLAYEAVVFWIDGESSNKNSPPVISFLMWYAPPVWRFIRRTISPIFAAAVTGLAFLTHMQRLNRAIVLCSMFASIVVVKHFLHVHDTDPILKQQISKTMKPLIGGACKKAIKLSWPSSSPEEEEDVFSTARVQGLCRTALDNPHVVMSTVVFWAAMSVFYSCLSTRWVRLWMISIIVTTVAMRIGFNDDHVATWISQNLRMDIFMDRMHDFANHNDMRAVLFALTQAFSSSFHELTESYVVPHIVVLIKCMLYFVVAVHVKAAIEQ